MRIPIIGGTRLVESDAMFVPICVARRASFGRYARARLADWRRVLGTSRASPLSPAPRQAIKTSNYDSAPSRPPRGDHGMTCCAVPLVRLENRRGVDHIIEIERPRLRRVSA